MTCESGWDARQVLQPIADAMGKKSNAADRPNRALSRREELCRGSLAPETNVLYYIAFVERGETRRVVSLRRANRSEVKHYVENV